MVYRLTRRAPALLALLLGALVCAWQPVVAHPALAGEEADGPRIAVAVPGSVQGTWGPWQLSAFAPARHRSPTWHRGTGRRASRAPALSPIAPAAGSIPAADPFIRRRGMSFARSPLRIAWTGRSAEQPRAPPAVN